MASVKLLACGFWLAIAALPLGSCQFPSYEIRSDTGSGGEDDGGSPPGGAGAKPTAGNGGTGGSVGGGNGGSVSPPLCGDEEVCQPAAPNGWRGPAAFYIGASDAALPDCPEGYGDPTDLHADPDGEPLICECTCTATDQACGNSDRVRLYNDQGCANPCAEAGAEECSAITTCSGSSGSIRARLMQPIGGCVADVTSKPGRVSWERDARLCEADGDFEECGAAQSCFPTPPDPFASQLCVSRVVLEGQAAPECPEAYPSGPELLYSTFEDQRTCGTCTCDGPNGGKCEGHVDISRIDCSQTTSTYTIGKDTCLIVNDLKTVTPHYVMTPGTCGVAEEPAVLGDIVPTGRFHAVCCL